MTPPADSTTSTGIILAAFVSLSVVLMAGKPYIAFLKERYLGQYIREDGPQSHHSKAGTPTSGGVLIMAGVLGGVAAVVALYGLDFLSPGVLSVLGVMLAFALLGFVDDFSKIAKKHNKGVSGYVKLAIQVTAGLLVGWWVMQQPGGSTVSLFGLAEFELGWLYPLFTAFVITGGSNAVNLTDGLDGLAASTAVFAFFCMALMLFPVAPELAYIAHALTGACLGFLVFNHYPAKVFMGDTGSLALGGALGALAVVGKLEMWLLFLAGIYIIETLSVILQVISFKSTGRRIFRMAPLHHHFELGGWREPKVVFVFVTAQLVFCALALVLYPHPVG